MNTLVDERVDTDGHLDQWPVCQDKAHADNPVPADFRLDWHGCRVTLNCAACVARFQRQWDATSARAGAVRCKKCWRKFSSFATSITVMPIWQ